MNLKDHAVKITVAVVTSAILAIGALFWTFALDRWDNNAWAEDIQAVRQEMKEDKIRQLRRELNEIKAKELDGTATKYDLLRKDQLERDYGELLKK
jgi:outer membrane lipopolysaccharide assembly protein LptE/RlpB